MSCLKSAADYFHAVRLADNGIFLGFNKDAKFVSGPDGAYIEFRLKTPGEVGLNGFGQGDARTADDAAFMSLAFADGYGDVGACRSAAEDRENVVDAVAETGGSLRADK